MHSAPYTERPKPCTVPQDLRCHVCDKSCSSEVALRAHLVRAHGARNPVRTRILMPCCPVCHINFGTRAKAMNHMLYTSPACGRFFVAHNDSLPPELISKLEAVDAKASTSNRKKGLHASYDNSVSPVYMHEPRHRCFYHRCHICSNVDLSSISLAPCIPTLPPHGSESGQIQQEAPVQVGE